MAHENKARKYDTETYRDREFHVYFTDEEWAMLDYCSDVLDETKSSLIRQFVEALYKKCI